MLVRSSPALPLWSTRFRPRRRFSFRFEFTYRGNQLGVSRILFDYIEDRLCSSLERNNLLITCQHNESAICTPGSGCIHLIWMFCDGFLLGCGSRLAQKGALFFAEFLEGGIIRKQHLIFCKEG